MTKEEALRAFDDILHPIYLEMEAGEAEDIHVKVAEKVLKIVALVQKETQEETEEKADVLLDQVMEERDWAEEWADKLAYAIAPMEEIGEHSSNNLPWLNAYDIATSKPSVKDEVEEKSEEVGETHGNPIQGNVTEEKK